MSRELQGVKRAARKAALSREQLEEKIREAHDAGESARKIAEAAGVSHTQVLRVLLRTGSGVVKVGDSPESLRYTEGLIHTDQA